MQNRSKFTIHRYDSVESTNTTAREWIREGCDEGTVIAARTQSAGRGRQGRTWTSLPRALLFSIVLKPGWPADRVGRLGFYACVSAALTAERHGARRVAVKWPNDLLIPTAFPSAGALAAPGFTGSSPGAPEEPGTMTDGLQPGAWLSGWAKWGGVLVETGIIGGRCDWAIVGVGLNVGIVPTRTRGEVDFSYASVAEAANRSLDLDLFLDDFLVQFGSFYNAVTGWPRVLAEWRMRDLLLGQPVTVEYGNELVTGVARSVDERGALILETSTAELKIEAGEAHVVK